MAQMKLAQALLRRKELQAKVDQLKSIKDKDLFEVKGKRMKVTDEIDDVVLNVPVLDSNELTHAYDWHARQLRFVDAAIQQCNWTTEITVDDSVATDYAPPTSKGHSRAAK